MFLRIKKKQFRRIFLILSCLLVVAALIVASLQFGKAFIFEKKIKTAMKLQGNWFLNNQTPLGDFVYRRTVSTGKQRSGYNIVRQAGSLYSLAQLYKKTKDKNIGHTLEKGFNFFKVLSVKKKPQKGAAIIYQKNRKSNASTLLLLALIEYMEADKKHQIRYLPFAKDLADFLTSTQLPDGGFIQEAPFIQSDYNNGETLYALTRMYLLSKDKKYLRVSEKAASHFIKEYGEKKFNSSFFPWGMAGFSYLFKDIKKEEYWKFMKMYTDEYLKTTGSNSYPKGNLGVFLEGIAHTAWIARNKDWGYYLKLKKYIETSLTYLLTLQMNGPGSNRTSSYKQIQGGLCYDYGCKTQRIDICQHYLSALYLYSVKVR